MERLKLLLREPALLLDFAETLVVLLVAFGLGLSGDQQNAIIALVVAIIGLAKGFTTSPFPVSVVPDLGRAVLVLLAAFGTPLSADQIAIAVTALGSLMTLVMRSQITPNRDPVAAVSGAGAGPVTDVLSVPKHRGQRGVIDLGEALVVCLLAGALFFTAANAWLSSMVGIALVGGAAYRFGRVRRVKR